MIFSLQHLNITNLKKKQPSLTNKLVDVVVTQNSYRSTISQQLFLDALNTPIINSISPTYLSVLGDY